MDQKCLGETLFRAEECIHIEKPTEFPPGVERSVDFSSTVISRRSVEYEIFPPADSAGAQGWRVRDNRVNAELVR